MRSLERFFRYIFWAIVTAVVAWIVKKTFQHAAEHSTASVRGRVQPAAATQGPKTLVRDPVCGTYVAEDISYSLLQGGENFHFCSRDCMDRYQRDLHSRDDRAANRLAAGA